MAKLVAVFIVLGLFILPVAAQDTPKAEVFGGYQYLRVNVSDSGVSQGFNFNGWNASLTGNFNKWFGVAADFSGAYKTISGVSVKAHTYTFGPVISLNREGTVNPFVHALFGGVRLSANLEGVGSGGTNGFAMLMGGGVDAKVNKNLAIRVLQADWVYYHVEGTSQSKNVRLSTGIVLRF